MTLASTQIAHALYTTPVGNLRATADDGGIRLLQFADTTRAETPTTSGKYPTTLKAQEHLQQLGQELKQYFARERKTFTVPVTPEGTDFQRAVWQALQAIPFGARRTYLQQAISMKNPEAIRAVAAANAANPIAIVIPCHRVVGANGELTGYAGGLWRKRWLLDFEQGALRLL